MYKYRYFCVYKILEGNINEMRTNIDIQTELLEKAKKLAHAKTKKETIHIALEEFIKKHHKLNLANSFGKIQWEGDLKKMRSNS